MAILLDEWGSSGKVRPTISDLYILLEGLNFLRARDFLLERVLGDKVPEPRNYGAWGEVRHAATATLLKDPPTEPDLKIKPNVRDFQLGPNLPSTDEIEESLDTMLDPSHVQIDDPSLLQSPLPRFGFDFLEGITSHWSPAAYGEGGTKLGEGAFGAVYYGELTGQLGLEGRGGRLFQTHTLI